jgi:VanZ family protein
MAVLKRWLPVVVWSAVILMTSNDRFSAAHTGGWLRDLFPSMPELANIALRKLMHLTGYGILGSLAFRATRVDFQRAVPVAFAVVFLVACTDEWHQSLYASRGASPWDVLLDVVGAAIAIGLMIRVKQLPGKERH